MSFGPPLEAGPPEEGRLRLQLPADPKDIVCCASWADVEAALDRSPRVFVLRPGQYQTKGAMDLPDHTLLLGLGPGVELLSSVQVLV